MSTCKFFIFIVFVSSVLGYESQNAPPRKFSHQVSLQRKNKHHFCSGSIINNRYILTAADCFFARSRRSKISALAGTNDLRNRDGTGVRYQIKKVVFYIPFHPIFKTNDIALLKTSETMSFNKQIAPIALGKDFVGSNVEVISCGWKWIHQNGRRNVEKWRHVRLMSMTNEECKKAPFPSTSLPIRKSQICTHPMHGETSCNKDAGSGLVDKDTNRIVGIVSRGQVPGECLVGLPGIFTRISEYVDWIEEQTK